jgi:spermidine/putrescine transport system permease protein
MRPSRGARIALGAQFALVLAFLYLPIAVLVGLSFNASGLPTAWTGFSTKWYSAVLQNDDILSAAGNTVVVAVASTLIATVLGTLFAYGTERARRRTLLDGLVFVPMVVPDIVLAIALLSFFNLVVVEQWGLELGLWSVVLSHAVFSIAFVAAIVRTRFADLDFSTLEASRDLGATELQTFLRITLPTILPGVIAGALVAFTLSLDEFVIAFFTAGSDVTFPIQVYSMIRFGVTPEINAIATIVVVLSAALILASLLVRRDKEVVR